MAVIALRRGVDSAVLAALLGAAALTIGVALARPGWLRWVYVGLMVVTWPIG